MIDPPEPAGDRGARVRLLVVTHSLSWGGAERFAATLLGGLDRARFDCSVCVVSRRPATYPVPEDVEEHRLGYGSLLDLPAAVTRLRRLLRGGRFDLVLSNVLKTNALTGLALAGLGGGKPDSLQEGGLRPRRQNGGEGAPDSAVAVVRPPRWVARIGLAPGRGDGLLVRLAAGRLERNAAALVANSEEMAAELARRRPGMAGRIHHLPNPTDFARIDRLAAEEPGEELVRALRAIGLEASEPRPDDAPRLLVAAGRLDRQKRPDLALAALARIRERRDARLVWCGDGPLRAEMERRADEMGLTGAASFAGFVANPFPLIRRADLVLLTSDFEGLPNALIEAQGLGVPAVATSCPFGPDEIVEEGVTGRLVEAGDAGALSNAVIELLEMDADRRRAMGEAARERTRRRYALERVLPLWAGLLADVAFQAAAPHVDRGAAGT